MFNMNTFLNANHTWNLFIAQRCQKYENALNQAVHDCTRTSITPKAKKQALCFTSHSVQTFSKCIFDEKLPNQSFICHCKSSSKTVWGSVEKALNNLQKKPEKHMKCQNHRFQPRAPSETKELEEGAPLYFGLPKTSHFDRRSDPFVYNFEL